MTLIRRLFSDGNEGHKEIAKEFLKAHSKQLKQIINSVLVATEPFQGKVQTKYMKYLELSACLLQAYKTLGYTKRHISLKSAVLESKGALPEDKNISRLLEKIEKHNAN